MLPVKAGYSGTMPLIFIHGLMMVIASGGILVELMRDSVTLMLPVSPEDIRHALESLKCFPLLEGYRNRPGCDLAGLENALIERAMERSGGNVTRAADLLGLTRATLDYRLKKARA